MTAMRKTKFHLGWFILLACLCMAQAALAGDVYNSRPDHYDPVTGYYYKAVIDKEERGLLKKGGPGIINLAIANPADGAIKNLFGVPLQGLLACLVMETGFKDGVVQHYSWGNAKIENNADVPKRPAKNRLLIGVRDREGQSMTLFQSAKDGTGLQKIVTLPVGTDWHLDVKNSKLRIVHQTGTTIRLENFDW